LLQGRNFSYLDTQLKRLGSPNFTHIPINAPKCPFAHFQQDGHMAMRNPTGRVNYQPNSWGEGPRASPALGHRSFASTPRGDKARRRPESFSDHYSQPRQFFESQTATEQNHIIAALTFELAKCERSVIRERIVSHLLNIDISLARKVAEKLGMTALPDAADAAVVPRDLQRSSALSIVENGPSSFAGRKIGVLVSDDCDADVVASLQAAAMAEGTTVEIIAPRIGGVKAMDGTHISANHMVDGAPSVLFDAVALELSEDGAKKFAELPSARAFVADAFAHCKFIAHSIGASPLLAAAAVAPDADDGLIPLDVDSADTFVAQCRQLRLWARERSTKS
jgi:catalase